MSALGDEMREAVRECDTLRAEVSRLQGNVLLISGDRNYDEADALVVMDALREHLSPSFATNVCIAAKDENKPLRAEVERLKGELKSKSGAFEHACRMLRDAQDALTTQLKMNEPNYHRALTAEHELAAEKARAERLEGCIENHAQALAPPAPSTDNRNPTTDNP